MGDDVVRTTLVASINRAFGAAEIGQTLLKLQPIRATDDFLSLCERLGFLLPVHGGDYPRYRRDLTIPPLGRRLLTTAFRAALLQRPKPIPLHIDIRDGSAEVVEITPAPEVIKIVLTRTKPPSRKAR